MKSSHLQLDSNSSPCSSSPSSIIILINLCEISLILFKVIFFKLPIQSFGCFHPETTGVSAKDKPFFESFVQTNAFLAYLQTLHLFGTSQSPFAEALRSLGHRKDVVSFSEVPEPPVSKMGGERGNFSAAEIWVKNRVGRPGWSAKEAVMELHLRWNSRADSLEHLGSVDEKILLASVQTVPLQEADEKETSGGVLEALEAVLVETQGNDRHLWEKLACDPRLQCGV